MIVIIGMEIKNPNDDTEREIEHCWGKKIEKQREAKKNTAIFSATDFRLARYFHDRRVGQK